MLTMSRPERSLDRHLAEAPGGFAWWYADLVDETRSGLVLIWSFGLPFLPGYLGAARAGRPEPAGAHPSLNVVVYDRGLPSFYSLAEHAPSSCTWDEDGERFRFGRSTIRSWAEGGVRRLEAELDIAVPGSAARLRGRLEITGAARRAYGGEASSLALSQHDWTPLTAVARGRARLDLNGRAMLLEGRAYHDRNGSSTPLDQLGIREWVWGRAAMPDRDVLWYLLWPTDGDAEPTLAGLELEADGSTRVRAGLQVRSSGGRLARFGMPWTSRLEFLHEGRPWLTVEQAPPMDDGPFYLRSFVRACAADGTVGVGTGESCIPARIDRPWQRPFVRMRVQHADAPSTDSAWLPLFAGPSWDRGRRLASAALERAIQRSGPSFAASLEAR
jgi:hypothetical protein